MANKSKRNYGAFINDDSESKVYEASLPLTSLIGFHDSDNVTNDYLFGPVNDENVENLMLGIKEDDFEGTILVWKLDGENTGKYMIYSGHRRAKAMELLGKDNIRCSVYDYPDDEIVRRKKFLRANIHSRSSAKAGTGDIYIARQMKYLEDIYIAEGITKKEEIRDRTAKEFNLSRNNVWRYKALLKATDVLLDAEKKGLIPLAQAASLALFEEKDQNLVVDAVTKASDSGNPLSRDELEKLLKEIKKTRKEQIVHGGLFGEDSIWDNEDDFITNIENDAKISDIISSALSGKMLYGELLENRQPENQGSDNRDAFIDNKKKEEKPKFTVYDKYNLRMQSLWNDVDHGKLETLSVDEVQNLMEQNKRLQEKLKSAYLYSELSSGLYHGIGYGSEEELSEKDLNLLSAKQVHDIKARLMESEKKGYGNFSAMIGQLIEREKEFKGKKV